MLSPDLRGERRFDGPCTGKVDAMDKIILDITGFYYSKTYEGELLQMAVGKTVEQLTSMTVGLVGDGDRGKLAAAVFKPGAVPSGQFLQTLTVDFTDDESPNPPKSRQLGSLFSDPPRGVYSYTDLATNVVPGDGVSFTPVWQYYHFDKDRRLKSGGALGNPTDRRIVPANQSQLLEVGDRVVWRLVLIGGVFERIQSGRSENSSLANQMQREEATSIATMAMLTGE